jgi:hypothetical protein
MNTGEAWDLTTEVMLLRKSGASRGKRIFIFSSVFKELIMFCCVNYYVIYVQFSLLSEIPFTFQGMLSLQA